MPFISVTRLRIRSFRFLPAFAVYAFRSLRQVQHAAGFQSGSLLPDRDRTFWTMTAWNTSESMLAYMTSGPHKAAMPKLLRWCDEASVVHWYQPEPALPTWPEADARMRSGGRVSKVHNPSSHHASLTYRSPRESGSVAIRPSPATSK